jgi:hypothetical protein
MYSNLVGEKESLSESITRSMLALAESYYPPPGLRERSAV